MPSAPWLPALGHSLLAIPGGFAGAEMFGDALFDLVPDAGVLQVSVSADVSVLPLRRPRLAEARRMPDVADAAERGIRRVCSSGRLPWSFLTHTRLTTRPETPQNLRKTQQADIEARFSAKQRMLSASSLIAAVSHATGLWRGLLVHLTWQTISWPPSRRVAPRALLTLKST